MAQSKQALSAPLQGFLNSLAYGWTRRAFRDASSSEFHKLLTDTPPAESYDSSIDSRVSWADSRNTQSLRI